MRAVGRAIKAAATNYRGINPSQRRLAGKSWAVALIVVGLTAAPANVFAETSLGKAVLLASEFDPGITALRHEIARKGIEIEAARDEGRPQFGLSAETSTTGTDGPAVVLTVSQVLFDWGRVKGLVGSATQDRVIAVADLKKGVERLTEDVSGYFIDIEGYDRSTQLTLDYLDFADRIAGHARARAEAGRGDNGEMARAELEVVRTKDQLAQLAADRQLAIAQLEFLMGRAPGKLALAPDLNFAGRYASASDVKKAVTLAPDYIIASAEFGRAEAGVDVVKAARLPSIKLQGQLRTDLERGSSRTAIGLSTGVDLGMGAISGRQVKAAQLEVASRKSNLAAVERNVTNAVITARDRIAVLHARESSQRLQLAQADAVLESYEQQFIAGQRELLDLLTTGRDQYDARLDYVDTLIERKRTEYEAAHDLGVLGTMIIAH